MNWFLANGTVAGAVKELDSTLVAAYQDLMTTIRAVVKSSTSMKPLASAYVLSALKRENSHSTASANGTVTMNKMALRHRWISQCSTNPKPFSSVLAAIKLVTTPSKGLSLVKMLS